MSGGPSCKQTLLFCSLLQLNNNNLSLRLHSVPDYLATQPRALFLCPSDIFNLFRCSTSTLGLHVVPAFPSFSQNCPLLRQRLRFIDCLGKMCQPPFQADFEFTHGMGLLFPKVRVLHGIKYIMTAIAFLFFFLRVLLLVISAGRMIIYLYICYIQKNSTSRQHS